MGKIERRKVLIWNIIFLAIAVIFVPIILVNFVFSYKRITNPNDLPFIFGYSPMLTSDVSDNLKDMFEPNDLLLFKNADFSTIKEEDIICFHAGGVFHIQKVNKVEKNDGVIEVTTSVNSTTGPRRNYIVREDNYKGLYVNKLTNAALLTKVVTGPIFVMSALALVVIAIVVEIVIRIREKNEIDRIIKKNNKE